ncbi:hypothetical protein HD806DRAFT_536710 [Xylariaceae sp. AK1471]|nr:hypothetical protein HD806DRAFT_536710 [Xylariaceae sp. AK1471]
MLIITSSNFRNWKHAQEAKATGMQLDRDVQQQLMGGESLTSEEQPEQNVLSDEDSEQSESEDEIDLVEESSDSEHESEFSDSDLEDNGPNLFECSTITFKDNAILVKDVCSTTECKKTFSSRSECIKHIKSCPASMSHSAVV